MGADHFYPLVSIFISLLCAYISFRYYLYYRGKIEAKTGNQDKYKRLIRGVEVTLLVSGLAFIGFSINLYNLSESAIPPITIATLTPGEETDLSLPGADLPSPAPSISPLLLTPSPESSPTAKVIPSIGTAVIDNTNGFDIFVRIEPGLQYEMLTQLPDGSRVEMTGEAQSADGFTW